MAAEPEPSTIDWLAVQTTLENVLNQVIEKELAVHLIKQDLLLVDTVYSLLLQLCRNETKVDDVITQLTAALHLTFLGRVEELSWEAARKIEGVLRRGFRTTQLHRKTFEIKKVMGIQDTVQETVVSVANGKMKVEVAVVHLRVFMMEKEKKNKNKNKIKNEY